MNIKIQRKILFWWSTVDGGEWDIPLSGWQNGITRTVPLPSTGSYRAVITFEVHGSGGSDDEIEIIRYADYE